ncbi:MAG TPA: phosphoribosyltransferase [Acidimicrobiales bacterium]|nr:phosphoribosyltransferase [Acidimicrobiales bacterium]
MQAMADRVFRDRTEAGRLLAEAVAERLGPQPVAPLVLALPRGGVPVGFEVARRLRAPLDVYVVRKLGVPGQPELAMGALATGGVLVMNEEVVSRLGIPRAAIEAVAAAEARELARRQQAYRGGRPPPHIEGATVVLVDDGLATGATMRAAVQSVRSQRPARLVVAVPTAPLPTCEELSRQADDVVVLTTPEPFFAVGCSYEDFSPTSDEEVRELLRRAAEERFTSA